MLLSFKYKFIFIKTKKSAGTSLEIYLSQYLNDPKDIITPVTPEDEALRTSQKIYPKNYEKTNNIGITRDIQKMRFWNHISASQIKERISNEIWDSFLKITSERHPYEKAVSLAWYHFPQQRKYSAFSSYLDYIVDEGDYENFSRYSINGKIIADTIIRYEHLLHDTNHILNILKLPTTAALPTAKSYFRKDRTPAVEVLSSAQKKRIQTICANEFNHFSYLY